LIAAAFTVYLTLLFIVMKEPVSELKPLSREEEESEDSGKVVRKLFDNNNPHSFYCRL
jgi:hypothetical protein